MSIRMAVRLSMVHLLWYNSPIRSSVSLASSSGTAINISDPRLLLGETADVPPVRPHAFKSLPYEIPRPVQLHVGPRIVPPGGLPVDDPEPHRPPDHLVFMKLARTSHVCPSQTCVRPCAPRSGNPTQRACRKASCRSPRLTRSRRYSRLTGSPRSALRQRLALGILHPCCLPHCCLIPAGAGDLILLVLWLPPHQLVESVALLDDRRVSLAQAQQNQHPRIWHKLGLPPVAVRYPAEGVLRLVIPLAGRRAGHKVVGDQNLLDFDDTPRINLFLPLLGFIGSRGKGHHKNQKEGYELNQTFHFLTRDSSERNCCIA